MQIQEEGTKKKKRVITINNQINKIKASNRQSSVFGLISCMLT